MSNGIETINILSKALCKASGLDIVRMDIQYNTLTELYKARVWIGELKNISVHFIYDISEDGQIEKIERTVIS